MKKGASEASLARVRDEWLRRVEAEYRSAAITHHLTHWLIQIGASPDLVRAGLRIVRDELTHAELSHRAYVKAGGQGGPRLARESLQLLRHVEEPLELDVARTCVEVFCLGETVAVRLFKELRDKCDVPVARRVLDRVLVDEVRHRDFGWTLLPWLLATPVGGEVRALVVRELPAYFERIRSVYAPEGIVEEPIEAVERAWGLMPAKRYGEILGKSFEKDYVSRFAKVGVDAQAAWSSPSSARAKRSEKAASVLAQAHSLG